MITRSSPGPRHTVRMARSISIGGSDDLTALTPQHFPESSPKVGVTQGVAQRVDRTVNVTQPVT